MRNYKRSKKANNAKLTNKKSTAKNNKQKVEGFAEFLKMYSNLVSCRTFKKAMRRHVYT